MTKVDAELLIAELKDIVVRFTSLDTLIDYDEPLKKLRKDLKKQFTELIKRYKKFIKRKGSKDIIKEILDDCLSPLKNLMESNNGLIFLEFTYTDPHMFEACNFQYKALIMNFISDFQNCQRILLEHTTVHEELKNKEEDLLKGDNSEHMKNKIKKDIEELKYLRQKGDPDICSVLKKFQYYDWRDNIVENFFIHPLLDNFLKLRTNLEKLYLMGYNYWRVPLSTNRVFLKDINDLINQELLSEQLLGDRLKREQLNFVFDNLKLIFKSIGKDKMLDRSEKMLELTIPRLIALKTLEQIDKIYKRKFEEATEGQEVKIAEIEPPVPLIEFALMSAKELNEAKKNNKKMPKWKTWQDILPKGLDYKEDIQLANGVEYTIEMDDNSIPELDKYGRFFMWPDFLPEDLHQEVLETSKLLRDINQAVIQDLEDYIIAEGITSSAKEFKKNRGKQTF